MLFLQELHRNCESIVSFKIFKIQYVHPQSHSIGKQPVDSPQYEWQFPQLSSGKLINDIELVF